LQDQDCKTITETKTRGSKTRTKTKTISKQYKSQLIHKPFYFRTTDLVTSICRMIAYNFSVYDLPTL